MEKNVVLHGDSYERLRLRLDAGYISCASVDLILTDPPYGIDHQSNRRVATPKLAKIANDDDVRTDWIADAHFLLKPGGRILLFTRWDVYPEWFEAVRKMFQVKSCIVWDKLRHGSGDLKHAFAPRHELVIYAVKPECDWEITPRLPDVLRVPAVPADQLIHPHQKPLLLIETLLKACSNPGDLVLDPFAGSGVTGRACKNLGRDYILIECDEERYKLAQRMCNVGAQPSLNLD